MKHVLFINRSYWPDVEATGQLLTELAEDLANEFHVTVMCGQPAAVPEKISYRSVGTQQRNGVRIVRLWHTRFNKANFWGRLANMVTFLASATFRSLAMPRVDVVVIETDPPLLCLLGRVMQLFRRSKLICYLQDIYPDVAFALGKLKKNWFTGLIERAFYGVYRRSHRLVVLSRDMRDHMVQRNVDSDRIAIIPNWVDTDLISPQATNNRFRSRHEIADRFVVMYSGNLGFSQRLEQVIEAADLLKDRDEFQFLMIGNGANRRPLEELAGQMKLPNIRFLDYQPKSQLAESLSAADLHVVFLDPRITHCLMPSKIYGILAAGVPVLALADTSSELAALVAENELGRVVDGSNARGIADAISQLAADEPFRRRAAAASRKIAVERFDRRVSVGAFRRLLHQTANGEKDHIAARQLA